MTNCLFCKIISGEMAAEIVFENDIAVAFKDINPQAPVHLLIIPRLHIATLNELDGDLGGRLLDCAKQLAKQVGIAESGYRTVINCNENGGQEVYHLHLHIIGGKRLSWPA